MATSHRERLETFGSNLINCMLVCVPRQCMADFTVALTRWSKPSAINKANGYLLIACDQDMRSY